MRIRELLQYELWSRSALRKPLTTTAIGIAALVLFFCGWYEIEMHWLTPGERKAARAALVEIDLLQNARSMNGKEFDSEEERAQLKFNAARDSMRTHRDREIVVVLSTYFILTTSPWDNARFALEYPGASIDGAPKTVLESWNSNSESRKRLHTLLHRVLD